MSFGIDRYDLSPEARVMLHRAAGDDRVYESLKFWPRRTMRDKGISPQEQRLVLDIVAATPNPEQLETDLEKHFDSRGEPSSQPIQISSGVRRSERTILGEIIQPNGPQIVLS